MSEWRDHLKPQPEARVIDLELALRTWSISASLEKGLATTTKPNGPWALQARKLLEENVVWNAIRPQLQKLLDEHQKQMQKDAGYV